MKRGIIMLLAVFFIAGLSRQADANLLTSQ